MAFDEKYGSVTLEHGNIGENEPVFVIRAQDSVSLDAIREYFRMAVVLGANVDSVHVERVLTAFQDWQNENGSKVPD